MTDELETYRRQFEAIEHEAREILDGLSDEQLSFQPDSTQWCIADCIEHLIVTGRHTRSNVAHAVDLARERAQFDPGPFRYGLLERWFVWFMEPPPRLRFPAPRAYRPRSRRPGHTVVADFLQLQRGLRQSLQSASGLDLAKVKVSNPVSRWIRFSLGQEFALTAAHERRHLWQVRRIRAHPAFPK
jgi:hypothetical protein